MKKRWIGWTAALLLLCAGGMGALKAAESGGSQGILYRVSDGEHELYLLGSIHVGSKAMYPMGPSIRQAVQSAEVLIFECDTQSPQALALTREKMACPEGDTLSDFLSEACRAHVEQAAEKAGYAMETLARLRPWAAASLFSVETTAERMGDRQPGVEEMVRRLGKGKETAFLEATEEQLELLSSFSPRLQEYLLDSACIELLNPSLATSHVQCWPRWWADGDVEAFARAYLGEMEAETQPELAREYHEALVTGRNRRMAKELYAWLQGGRPCLATIGLMHLALPGDSVLCELEALGCTVEKIEN